MNIDSMNIKSMNMEELSTASPLASQQPHTNASICTADEPSISILPPPRRQCAAYPAIHVPKTDEDWDANNDSLGSMLVHQVMVTRSVNEKKECFV